MLRSRLRPVFSSEACVNSVRTAPTREPRPILPTSPPASAEIRSENSTRAALKPVVPTLAMLLPMTDSAAPLLMRPLRPVDSAPKIAIPVSSSGAGALGAELDDADRGPVGGAHRRGHLVGGLGDGVAHRRRLSALDHERAAVEADFLAEQVQERGAARVLRLARELVEPVVHAGQLL